MNDKVLSIYEYSSDVFSQNGEDGILEFIFNKLNIEEGLLLEVGANDGIWFSNTRNLYTKKNNKFKTILIEGDKSFFSNLQKNTENFTNIFLSETFIVPECDSPESLDSIIHLSTFYEEKFVLVSIDIDGLDFDVWKHLKARPIVVIIEVPIFLEKDPDKKNVLDYINLGKDKGYTFIGHSGYPDKQSGNMIFVTNENANSIEVPELHERILLHNGTKCNASQIQM